MREWIGGGKYRIGQKGVCARLRKGRTNREKKERERGNYGLRRTWTGLQRKKGE